MTMRERTGLFKVALFNPRKAAREELYDGRVIGAVWLNILCFLPSLILTIVGANNPTRHLLNPKSVWIEIGVYAAFVVLAVIMTNWLFPWVLMRRLRPQLQKELTKKERKELKNLPQATLARCRQMILFAMLVAGIVCQPTIICGFFFSSLYYISYVNALLAVFVSAIWLYRVIYPKYVDTKSTSIKKLLLYWLINIALILLTVILIIVLAAIVVAVLGVDISAPNTSPSIMIGEIQYSTGLKYLDLSQMDLRDEDIASLYLMENLIHLRLSHNQISDLTPLAGLTQLVGLDLSYNQISDISPLAKLKRLRDLGLPIDHQIDDTSLVKHVRRVYYAS